jgi:peptidyl-prolyl cis-trans isomerase SurA
MQEMFVGTIPARFPWMVAAAITAGLTWTVLPSPVAAQEIVASVNGEPITAVDIAQRTRLIQASTQKAPGRKEVIEELIEERIKIQAAQRYRLEITDAEVDNVLAGMGQRMRANAEQFEKALTGSGISVTALKRKIRADLGWQQIVRGKFAPSIQVRERDVKMTADTRKKDDKEAISYAYTLRPILFIVPRGSPDAVIEARRREADGLRARFQSCDEGLRMARGLKDVAVRDAILRTSGDFQAKVREVLESTAVGKLTPPDITLQGVELFAVCEKKETKVGDTGKERDVRDELLGQRVAAEAKRYMQELRRSAKIEIK